MNTFSIVFVSVKRQQVAALNHRPRSRQQPRSWFLWCSPSLSVAAAAELMSSAEIELMARRPHKNDIRTGKDAWITYGDLAKSNRVLSKLIHTLHRCYHLLNRLRQRASQNVAGSMHSYCGPKKL